MTGRERMMIAIAGGIPDRVPVAPDMSNMIPAKFTGKKFYDIYKYNNPPLWKAYIDVVKKLGTDAWFLYGSCDAEADVKFTAEEKIISQDENHIHSRTTFHTPKGDLFSETFYPSDQPPTTVRGLIKDLKEDFEAFKYIMPDIKNYSFNTYREMQKELGELGVCGLSAPFPGYQTMVDYFDDKLKGVVYAHADYPDVFEELNAFFYKRFMEFFKINIEAKPDFILLGGSGAITLASVDLFKKFALPFIKETTALAKEAGVLTMLHSCGKERALVELVANETDLNCVNPLEIPPMGDCDLAEIKKSFGDKISLMGNIHTTDVMLYGSVEDVKKACRKAIDDAAYNGGFILSTGDQCGRDTPDENIKAMVEVAETYGKY